MRIILRLAVAVILLASMVVAGSAVANAAPKVAVSAAMSPQATSSCCRLFKNQDTHLWLDDSLEFGLRTFQYNAGIYQQWNITHWNDDTWEMKNLATGRCIDDSFEHGLRPFTCNSSKYQSWIWHNWPDGTTEIKNQLTGRCLDNYYNLRAVQCDTSTSQSWY